MFKHMLNSENSEFEKLSNKSYKKLDKCLFDQ